MYMFINTYIRMMNNRIFCVLWIFGIIDSFFQVDPIS